MSNTYLKISRRTIPRDVATASVKVIANAVTTSRRMGRGAPCLLGCPHGQDVREHYLRCQVLQNVAAFMFARVTEHGPAQVNRPQVFLVGCACLESVVDAVAWHDAWIQSTNKVWRAWREGQAILAGDGALIARIRATSCRFSVVSASFVWADGAPIHRRRGGGACLVALRALSGRLFLESFPGPLGCHAMGRLTLLVLSTRFLFCLRLGA